MINLDVSGSLMYCNIPACQTLLLLPSLWLLLSSLLSFLLSHPETCSVCSPSSSSPSFIPYLSVSAVLCAAAGLSGWCNLCYLLCSYEKRESWSQHSSCRMLPWLAVSQHWLSHTLSPLTFCHQNAHNAVTEHVWKDTQPASDPAINASAEQLLPIMEIGWCCRFHQTLVV